jgi:hypothetical protein
METEPVSKTSRFFKKLGDGQSPKKNKTVSITSVVLSSFGFPDP